MTRGKGIYDDEKEDGEPKGGRRDQGREGGAETGEATPDVAETDQEPTA
jgi:hypothetical protein